jgi:hypothetical protein
VGLIGCLFLDLVGPLFGLPPLVERFPAWHPAGWVFTFVEVISILSQTLLLVLAAVALHQRLFPKNWVFWPEPSFSFTIRPGLLFRGTQALAALLVLALGGLAIIGYWVEALGPVWRWLPFTFAILLVRPLWRGESRRPAPPVPPVIETPPLG